MPSAAADSVISTSGFPGTSVRGFHMPRLRGWVPRFRLLIAALEALRHPKARIAEVIWVLGNLVNM